MRRVILSTAVIAALPWCPAAEGSTPLAPVRAELLDGDTLQVARENFAIDSPGAEWQWQQAQLPDERSSLYVCQHPGGGRFMLTVTPDSSLASGGDWFQKLLKDSQASQARRGARISNLTHRESQVPTAGSFRWSAALDVPGAGQMGWQGFATRGDRIYSFQYYGNDPRLAAAFEKSVASFRTLRPGGRLKASVATAGMVLSFVGLVFGASLGWLINLLAGRSRVNPGTAAASLIVAIVVLESVFLWSHGLVPADPEAAGQVLGSVMGYALIPLLCAVGISFVYRRRLGRSA